MNNHNNWTDMDGVVLEVGQTIIVDTPDGLKRGTIINFGARNIIVEMPGKNTKWNPLTGNFDYLDVMHKKSYPWHKARCLVLDKYEERVV